MTKTYHIDQFYSEDEAYDHLAKEICAQAIKDYRKAIQYDKKRLQKEVERFFLSDWFHLLSNMNGEFLIEIIRQQENYYD